MLLAIRAFFEAIAKGFSCVETKINKQCETEVLKNKKSVEKRSDKQEDLILDMLELLKKYQVCMNKFDRVRVNRFAKKIKGVN